MITKLEDDTYCDWVTVVLVFVIVIHDFKGRKLF